jgi:hypothetical protein
LAASIARLSEGVTKMPLPMIRLRSPSPSEAAPKSGASSAIIVVVEGVGMHEVGVGMVAAEIGQRHEVQHRALARAEAVFEDFLGIGAGHRAHGVEDDAEATGSRPRMASKSKSCSISAA